MWDTEKGQCGREQEKPLGLLHVKAGVGEGGGVGGRCRCGSRIMRSVSGLPSPTRSPSHHHATLPILLSAEPLGWGQCLVGVTREISPSIPDNNMKPGRRNIHIQVLLKEALTRAVFLATQNQLHELELMCEILP